MLGKVGVHFHAFLSASMYNKKWPQVVSQTLHSQTLHSLLLDMYSMWIKMPQDAPCHSIHLYSLLLSSVFVGQNVSMWALAKTGILCRMQNSRLRIHREDLSVQCVIGVLKKKHQVWDNPTIDSLISMSASWDHDHRLLILHFRNLSTASKS